VWRRALTFSLTLFPLRHNALASQAYFETYEQTKRTNEQLTRDLRERQKELARQLAEAQRKARGGGAKSSSSSSSASASSSSSGAVSEDARVADELIKKRTEYDKLRRKTADLRVELEKLQGELVAINNMRGVVGAAKAGGGRRGSGATGAADDDTFDGGDDFGGDDMTTGSGGAGGASGSVAGGGSGGGAGGSAIQRRVRQLENKLDKTAIKHEEALSIRRTYEQIVKRLKDERVSYDTQIAAIEKTIAAKTHDFDELRTLAGEAARAMEASQVELNRVRGLASTDREKRARELRERQSMAGARRHQAEISLARERARRDLLAEVAGDLGVREEKNLVQSVEAARHRKSTLADHSALIKRKLEAYEAAWRRIKDATGVTEIGEVTVKMAGQVRRVASCRDALCCAAPISRV
jgi:hypothetical protein